MVPGPVRFSPVSRFQQVMPAPKEAPIFAGLDLGTNNCRLIVAKPALKGWKVLQTHSKIVRLGAQLAETGRLSEEAMLRAMAALRACVQKVGGYPVATARYVATEACRRASNGAEFAKRVEAELGILLEIISPAEEARLAMMGCAPLLRPVSRHALIFDIGGGSTEVSWLQLRQEALPETLGWLSVPYGVVTLSEEFGSGKISQAAFSAMKHRILGLLQPFEERFAIRDYLSVNPLQMIGSSGTVTTLAAVYLELPRYDWRRVDGQAIPVKSLAGLNLRLAEQDYAERASLPCIGKDRADLIVAGCAILSAICELWPVEEIRVADRGVREGILVDLLSRHG